MKYTKVEIKTNKPFLIDVIKHICDDPHLIYELLEEARRRGAKGQTKAFHYECNCEDLRTCRDLYGNKHGAEDELRRRAKELEK